MTLVAVAASVVITGALSTARMTDRSWNWQNPKPQGNSIRALVYPSQNVGYAVGRSGAVLKTTTSGASWEALDTGSARDYSAAAFATTDLGWIAGENGAILKTINGGTGWTSQNSHTTVHLRGLAAASNHAVIAVGDASGGTATIRYTVSGGATWTAGVSAATAGLNAVAFPSTTLAWAVGDAGTMAYSPDGGATWTTIPALTAASLNDVAFVPGTTVGYAVGNNVGTAWTVLKTTNGTTWSALTLPGTGVPLLGVDVLGATGQFVTVAGANGSVYRSNDGGMTWSIQSPPRLANVTFSAVAMPITTHTHLAGDFGTLLRSRDSGATWLSAMQSTPYNMNSAVFTSASTGWAVGSNGLVMKTADGGITWTARTLGPYTLRGISALNFATSAWVVGDGGRIWRTTDAGNTWVEQDRGIANRPQLNDIFFDSANKGTIVGNNGTILTTSNSGQQWSKRDAATTQPFYSVWYPTGQRGWVVGGGGQIRTTTTGGSNWNSQASGTGETLYGVWAADTQTVYVAGANGTVLKTVNGGTTWSTIPSATVGAAGENLRTVAGSSANRVWVAGDRGTVLLTTDGGATWSPQNAGLPSLTIDSAVSVNRLAVTDANNVTLVAGRGHVRTTTNGGSTWTPSYYGTYQSLEDIVGSGTRSAWAVGANGAIINTFDAGSSWFRQVPNTTANLNGTAFPAPLVGWAVGDNGTIRYTTSGGWTWATQTSGTTARLADVDAASLTNAIAVGNGVIRYTTNGTTWSPGGGVGSRQYNRVSMASANNAWAVANTGAGETIMRTTDSGLTWAPATTLTTTFSGIHFLPGTTTGWAVGPNGSVYKTTSGTSWTAQTSGTTANLRDVHFIDADRGRIVGDDGASLVTLNGGSTWSRQDTGTTSKSLRGTTLAEGVEGWAVGTEGTVLRVFDLTIPRTTLIVSPPEPDGWFDDTSGDDSFTWYVSSPIIQLLPSIGSTAYYSWNSTATPQPYMGSLVASEGASTLYYRSIDASSQAEDWQSATFYVDVSAPTSPTAVSVSSVTASSAQVSWTASTDMVSGVREYEVWLNGSPLPGVVTSPTVSHTLTDLTANTIYTVTVYARDKAGNLSEPSTMQTFTTEDAVGEPLGVTMSVNYPPDGDNGWYVTVPTVTLQSIPTSVPAVIYYRPDLTETTSGPSVSPTSFPAPAGAYTLYYEASATAGPPRPIVTYEASLTVDPYPMPAPVGLVTTSTPGYALLLSWDSVSATATPSGTQGYEVSIDGVAVASLPFASTSYEFTGLLPGTAYSVGVRSFNNAGTYSATSTAAGTTEPEAAPDKPRIVYARGTDGDAIYVDWEPISYGVGAVSYGIERWRSGEPTFSHVATVTGQLSLSYVDTELRSSTTYWYRVRSSDDRGDSAYSTPTAATTRAPSRVSGLGSTPANNGALVSWLPSPNPAVVGYYVYRDYRSLATAPTTLTVTPTAATSFIDPYLADGSYWYRVAAIDASGVVGALSVELRVDVLRTPDSLSPHAEDPDGDACAACHRGHTAFGRNLSIFAGPESDPTTAAASQATCLGCHNGFIASDYKTPLTSPFTASRHDIKIDPYPGTQYCSTCHDAHRSDDPDDLVLLNVNGVRGGSEVCYECHGDGSTLPQGDLSVFEQSVHAGVPSGSPTGVVCGACHDTHASANEQLLAYSGWMLCMQCHGGRQDPSTPDILTLISAGGDHRNRHDLTTEDQVANGGSRMTCQNCHNTHAVTGDYPLVDPYDPSPAGVWTQGLNEFCFRCHDGNLPNDGDTLPWVRAPLGPGGISTTADIESRYSVNAHGSADSTVTALYLRPEMGYAVGDTLGCDTCHDGHGTVNPMNLRQSVKSADGSTILNGLLVAPVSSNPADGYDFRFFCGSCHDITPDRHFTASGGTSIAAFPTNCMAAGCHGHFGDSF